MTTNNVSKRILGPFNRVEGDLEVTVEITANVVSKAWVNAPLFRGYEQILQGKDPRDTLVYTPRICGICSVSQSVAAATALAKTQNIVAELNGQLSTNIILATENMADHLSHFYLFFMPDFARNCYDKQLWFAKVSQRFKAQTGSVLKQLLPARSSFMHITGILAGKWPHSLAIQPGGTSKPVAVEEKIKLLTLVRAFRFFLEETLFGVPLETVTELQNEDELSALATLHPNSDLAIFLKISRALQLSQLGKAYDRFMSYGAYELESSHLFQSGLWDQSLSELDQKGIKEDISHSWLDIQSSPKHPYKGSTIPGNDAEDGYSWCKAPRLNEQPVEVGAIARQMVNAHPLIVDLVKKYGANVQNRILSRLLELALVVPQMENWIQLLQPGEPFCKQFVLPDEAQGAGLVEAARGSLGHWLRIKNGKVLNYQIIAPTTWNFSPRDQNNKPGALELALEGTVVDTSFSTHLNEAISLQHIIRSFDPCMVCTVH